eukprot:gene19503-21431_t
MSAMFLEPKKTTCNIMATIAGFKIFPVAFDSTVQTPHFLYIKKHTHQKSSVNFPADKTLFIVNVPPYCTRRGLRNVLKQFGPIESIFIQVAPGHVDENTDGKLFELDKTEKHKFKVAYVVFKDASSVNKFFNCDDFSEHNNHISTVSQPVKTGMEKWTMEYRKSYPDPVELQNQIDKYMQEFDVRAEKEKERERLLAETDEEGWTLVTHGGKNKGVPQVRVSAKERKKKKEKEVLQFYSFQQRESKREHIAQLRKKFEEDKKKIELMRNARKFKPF